MNKTRTGYLNRSINGNDKNHHHHHNNNNSTEYTYNYTYYIQHTNINLREIYQ